MRCILYWWGSFLWEKGKASAFSVILRKRKCWIANANDLTHSDSMKLSYSKEFFFMIGAIAIDSFCNFIWICEKGITTNHPATSQGVKIQSVFNPNPSQYGKVGYTQKPFSTVRKDKKQKTFITTKICMQHRAKGTCPLHIFFFPTNFASLFEVQVIGSHFLCKKLIA